MKKSLLFVFSVLLALSLCACGETSPISTEPVPDTVSAAPLPDSTVSPSEAPEEIGTPATEATAEPEMDLPAPADMFESVLDSSGSYTDDIGNEYSYSYRLPGLIAVNEDAARLNRTIQDSFLPLVDEEDAHMQDGLSLVVEHIDWDYYANGSLLSLVIQARYPNDYVYYLTVNFDCSSGTEAGLTELCAYAGIPEEELPSLSAAAVETYYKAAYGDMLSLSYVQESYDNTIARLTKTDNGPLYYLGESGKLYIIAEVETPVGNYWIVLPITG